MVEFETGHTDLVHDIQLDYYGRRLATASSDCSIRIFDVASESHPLLAQLQGHNAAVWQVSWAHPKYGTMIASASFDNTVIIWKETETGWTQVYRSTAMLHSASVNGVGWAASELGLLLATASADGSVGVIEYQSDGSWLETKVPSVDAVSCASLCWAPASVSITDEPGDSPSFKRFVVGGCENCLKIVSFVNNSWMIEKKLLGHTDWVLDVAWAPAITSSRNCIASASQDGKVLVWKERDRGMWTHTLVHDFGIPVYRIRWSITGHVLSVSDANQAITLWKEIPTTGKWQQVTY